MSNEIDELNLPGLTVDQVRSFSKLAKFKFIIFTNKESNSINYHFKLPGRHIQEVRCYGDNAIGMKELFGKRSQLNDKEYLHNLNQLLLQDKNQKDSAGVKLILEAVQLAI